MLLKENLVTSVTKTKKAMCNCKVIMLFKFSIFETCIFHFPIFKSRRNSNFFSNCTTSREFLNFQEDSIKMRRKMYQFYLKTKLIPLCCSEKIKVFQSTERTFTLEKTHRIDKHNPAMW